MNQIKRKTDEIQEWIKIGQNKLTELKEKMSIFFFFFFFFIKIGQR